MSLRDLTPARATHAVLNQPPPLEGYNLFEQDRALSEALQREGAGWAEQRARRLGEIAGGEPMRWGAQANAYPPVLRTHDRYGHRIDEVEYHPAWHELMRLAVAHELHALPWRDPRPGAHVARAALFMLLGQAESGHGCPISMTYSGVPALRAQPEIAAEWEPRLTSTQYDPRLIPSDQKTGALCGMAMTEKQGGSDVRANTTRARALGRGGPGGEYEITGHKWFCSAPMCDAFLVLAHTERGLSCFLLPRWLPDGSRNRFYIQRLKDKLGNRSNASSEVEFDAAWARMVGEEGRGVATIIEMVNHTRLDCVIGVAAQMRQAVAQATHHTAHRSAFGKVLTEQPLMQNVLADLCIESEAATTAMMHLARAYDEGARDEHAQHFARLATAVVKYWVCKRAPMHVAEALECLGGSGYVEESIMPRLYREAPLNGIWEGSGNVICLDVLRAMGREPESVEAFFEDVGLAGAAEPRLAAFVSALRKDLGDFAAIEYRARHMVERLALALQASLLVRHGDAAVADAFCASRLTDDHGRAFGTLPRGVDCKRIIERARPQVG
ncbi:MAG TPA: acyl-CoA dehydrogenase family protein [Candidatus Margulisiibacteriota bacterium]|nr:acyl-CoA dehydrogenase family protein [Candidatus Margulisiibacteriota bacterium]